MPLSNRQIDLSAREARLDSRRMFALAAFTTATAMRAWDNNAIDSPQMERSLAFAQLASATIALDAMNKTAKIQQWSGWADQLKPNPTGFAGSTAAGFSIAALLRSYRGNYRNRLSSGTDPAAAAQQVRGMIKRDVSNEVQQSYYNAHMAGHWSGESPRQYVYVLRGASNCSRCILLAGRRYRNIAWRRHPGCDCGFMHVSELPKGDDWTPPKEISPRKYWDSLDDAAKVKSAGSVANAKLIDSAEGTTDFNRKINSTLPKIPRSGRPGSPLKTDDGSGPGGLYALDLAPNSVTGTGGRDSLKKTVMVDADNKGDAVNLMQERGFVTESPTVDMPTRAQIDGGSRAL